MSNVLMLAAVLLQAATLAALVLLWRRGGGADLGPVLARFDAVDRTLERLERALVDALATGRSETQNALRDVRVEVAQAVKDQSQAGEQRLETMRNTLESRLKAMQEDQARQLGEQRKDAGDAARQTREDTAAALKAFNESVLRALAEGRKIQGDQLDAFSRRLADLASGTETRLELVRKSVEDRLTALQQDNNLKLEQMRKPVDEQLQGTLEKRLGESFKIVSERLEAVHKGLGEMQSLANGVGDLKRVLTNVRTRGTWGEIQLGNLLEQVLTPEQYAANVATRPGSGERVEYAIRLPGRGDTEQQTVWLPIDAKFPQEDYQRLLQAAEAADPVAMEEAGRGLEIRLRNEARSIAEKYLAPPFTTDFALLFLPTEGLYAEVIRRPGLVEALQRENRVVVAGPTTLAALLNSLQMGFRTLAIQKRSSEVWEVLGAVKTEFGKFGDTLDKVRKKLDEAGKVVDNAQTRTRVMNRTLRQVESLPAEQSRKLLGFHDGADEVEEDDAGAAET